MGGNWPAALRLARNVIYDLNNWTEGWGIWNLMSDQEGGPRHAGGTPGRGSGTIVNADTTTSNPSATPAPATPLSPSSSNPRAPEL
jgi:Glycosyl hydrolase family 30 TIM-barrel domain